MRIFTALITALLLLAAAAASMGQTFRTVFDFPHLSGDPSENIVTGSDGNFYGAVGGGTVNGEGLIIRISPDGDVTPLHIFRSFQNQGSNPVGALVELGDGVFYGLTNQGGNNGYGTIFKITRTGELTTLHHFNSLDGANPRSGLTLGNDGNLYGVTPLGGANNKGCIYRVTPAGEVTVIYSIPVGALGHPYARLTKGNDGALYGAVTEGQTLFKVTTGGVFTSLHVLGVGEGATILSGMALGADGNFYGTTYQGATNNSGTVFRMTPTGTFTVLLRFSGSNGVSPNSVIFGPDGNLYGTTRTGGTNQYGTLFRLSVTGTYTRLRSFSSSEGERPMSGLTVKGGVLYGAVGQASGVFFSLTTAGVFTPIARFDDRNLGSDPRSRLLQASDGNFYGTAQTAQMGSGVVFRVSSQGDVEVLHAFARADGGTPVGSLIEARDGNFYGVTSTEGPNGRGTIFRLTSSGTYTILHSFSGSGSVLAAGGVVEGNDGNFYGLLSQNGDTNSGSVYRLTPAGEFSIVHNFNNSIHGGFPGGALLKGPDGSFYGTTHSGGGGDGRGTVFRVSSEGAFSVISRIPSLAYRIQDGLVFGQDGHLYGVALYTGGSDTGALIRCTLDGSFSVVTNFGGEKGSTPMAGPAMGPDGNFYGTTSRSVAGGPGSVYRVTPSGVLTTLKNFVGTDGDTPLGGVTVGVDGDLYGTTSSGGRGGGGTVFSLDIFPTVRALDASEITARSAKLRATVDPNSTATAVDFRFGNAVVKTVSVPAGDPPKTLEHVLTDLMPHSKYSFQIEARNGIAGPVRSELLEFETANSLPKAATRLWHATFDANGRASLDVSTQLSDPDGDQVSITAHTQGTYGGVTRDGTTFTYQIRNDAVGFTGNDTFTYTVSDGFGGTATGTVTLVNTAPIVEDRTLHPPAGDSFTIDVNPLLSDDDQDQVRIARVTQGSQGSVSFEGNLITFSVAGVGYQGNDRFTFTVEDGAGGGATGTITLTNLAPTALTQSIHPAFGPGGETVISLSSISNDADGDDLTFSNVVQGSHGEVSVAGDGLRYVTSPGFSGNDSFTFTVTDGRGARASGSITFTNRPPVAQGKVLHAPKTGVSTVVFTASSESSDADSDPRTVSVLSYTGNGKATSDGSEVTFINGGFVGEEVITVRVSDGRGGFSDAAISLRNTGPSTTDKVFHAPVVGSSLVVFQVNTDSADPDNDSRVVAVLSYDGAGSVNTDGTDVAYKNKGLTGSETIVLRVTDERGGVANATIRVSNQAPIAANALITWPGKSPLEIGVLPLTSDPEGDGLSISAFSVPAYGTLVSSDTGMVTYVPGDAFEGRDAFTYTVQDDRGAFAVATIQVQSTSKSHRTVAAEGEPVAGAGEVGSGIPAGAVWDSFGPPSLIGSELGWLGTFKTPDAKLHGVFTGEPEAPTLWIKTGDTAVDDAGVSLTGKTFRQLGQPVFSAADEFAVKGKLRGKGIEGENDEAIWVMTGGSLRRVAGEGAVAPGTEGAKFHEFSSIAFTEEGVLYLVARLRAGGRVSAKNDSGLWRWTESEGLALLLREGMSIRSGLEEVKLRSFTTLSPVERSSGEGRYDAASSLLPVRLSLSGKLESIAMIHPDGSLEIGPFATSVFGPPDISGEDGEGAVLEELLVGVDGVTSRDRWQITDIKTDQSLARSMGAAPGIDGAVFAKFLDPVSGLIHGKTLTAFIAKVRVASPVGKPIQRSGIWTRTHEDGEEVKLLAEQGGIAPETEGERFAEFVSLAVLPDYGPVFRAKLVRSGTVRRQNDEGLWAADSSGTLRLILREGETVLVGGAERRLVSFSTLDTVLGSPAQRRSFGNGPGRLVCRANFDDGTTAIVRVTVP